MNNIFKKSDIVFVYATSTTTNEEMIKLKNLNLLKDSSVILIMSRASVINFDDLYKLLKSRKIYAGIDVFPKEPFPKKHPFRKLKNVIFSPHRAGALDIAFKNMGEIVIKDIRLIAKKLQPKHSFFSQWRYWFRSYESNCRNSQTKLANSCIGHQ